MATRFVAETGDATGFTALVLLLSRATDSATQFSTLLAALVVLDAVVTHLCGSVGDRFDRQRVMLLACGGGAVCYAGMFLAADHVWVVFALACLSTVFESLYSVVATMAGMFVVARLTERHGAVRLLQGGLAAQVLGFLGLALAVVVAGLPALVVTALALLVHRGGQAFTGASSYDLLAHAVPDEARARSTSWVDFATSGAFGLGVWAAGPLADLAGLGALSPVSAGLLALSMLAARQLGRVARRQGFDGATPATP